MVGIHPFGADREDDVATLGVLHGVGEEIDENLTDLSRIGVKLHRPGRSLDANVQSLLIGEWADEHEALLDHRGHRDVAHVDGLLSGLDARMAQELLDQIEQMPRRMR